MTMTSYSAFILLFAYNPLKLISHAFRQIGSLDLWNKKAKLLALLVPLSGATVTLDKTTPCHSSDLTRSSAIRYEG